MPPLPRRVDVHLDRVRPGFKVLGAAQENAAAAHTIEQTPLAIVPVVHPVEALNAGIPCVVLLEDHLGAGWPAAQDL